MFVSLLGIYSCVPDSKKLMTNVELDTKDVLFQKISDHQFAGRTDSLLSFFGDRNPTYRYLAARAFASHQDPAGLDSLYKLLDDPIIEVREMAAFAIGQLKSPSSEVPLLSGFRQKDTISVDNAANGAILYAIGKLGKAELAEKIITADGYRDTDTLLLEGQMKAIYAYALRGTHSPLITNNVVEKIKNKNIPVQVRLAGAHYLARATNLDIENVKFQIAEALVAEQNVEIKMALATSLRNTNGPEIQAILLDQLDLQQDYRVKCNIIRTLQSYDYAASKEKILALLRDKNLHVARTASSYIAANGDLKDIVAYRNIAVDSVPWQLKTELYNSILSLLPYYYTKTNNATRWQVQQAIAAETNPIIISDYLRALGNDTESYPYIMKYGKESSDPVIKTASIEALGKILGNKEFYSVYQTVTRSNKRKILNYIMESMSGIDEGIVGAGADVISNPETGLAELIDSTNFLLDIRSKLSAPSQIESIYAVERALAYLRGVDKPNFTKVNTSKAVNWARLKEVTPNTKAIIKTTKGIFTLKFFLNEAPGTVLNFLDLASSNFYKDKIFHRVVPNFVIQTGSPRGDNYGGADYVIKSEVGPLSYKEGYVGMASAGLHTESTQWFITHSATPHLDGNYSIFAKVIHGMEVIHRIQKGDKILDVIITNL